MIDRNIIEKILHANGLKPTASDEEIRALLLSAKWHSDDVETALTVLRENTTTHKTRVDSTHRIFRSDAKLKPETIASLLGIDMSLPLPPSLAKKQSINTTYGQQVLSIFVTAILLAIIIVIAVMWLMQAGLFHSEDYLEIWQQWL